MLHPKYKRYFKQILPFPIFWLIFASIYSFVEYGLLGDLSHYPTTGNRYDFIGNLVFTNIACVFVGFLQGWIEVFWLRRRFVHKPVWVKILFKSLFYIVFIIFFLIAFSTMNSYLNFSSGNLMAAMDDSKRFIENFAFWSIIIYISVTVSMAIFFSEISQHLGDGVLFNFLFSKYHRPKQETRIFMFLDMKSSTTIAENLGHEKYFNLLKDYYADMSVAILETSGEIYQYVGDEIVVSWPEKIGLYRNNCINCYFKISKVFEEKRESYLKRFGLLPEFKAGYHIGQVTTGEIGIVKKDIVYTGDVLNTTARIQGECNTYDAKVLISSDLLDKLNLNDEIKSMEIGKLILRGKTEAVKLHQLYYSS